MTLAYNTSLGSGDDEKIESIGEILRLRREELGFSLEDVELKTKIRKMFIVALEGNQFQDIPGSVYVTGFLKNYAEFLGLSSDYLLSLFAPYMVSKDIQSEYKIYLPRQKRRFLSAGTVMISIILVGVAIFLKPAYERLTAVNEPAAVNEEPKVVRDEGENSEVQSHVDFLSDTDFDSTIDFVFDDEMEDETLSEGVVEAAS